MSIPEWVTDLAFKCNKRWDTDTPDAWEAALDQSRLSEVEAKKVLNSFASATKPTVADFQRAKRRLFPPDPCRECDDTGQIWDGAKYYFCAHCPRGAHMRDVNERIARESSALSPVWARGLPPEARRTESAGQAVAGLCGACGAPSDEHNEAERETCSALDPRRRLEVVR